MTIKSRTKDYKKLTNLIVAATQKRMTSAQIEAIEKNALVLEKLHTTSAYRKGIKSIEKKYRDKINDIKKKYKKDLTVAKKKKNYTDNIGSKLTMAYVKNIVTMGKKGKSAVDKFDIPA